MGNLKILQEKTQEGQSLKNECRNIEKKICPVHGPYDKFYAGITGKYHEQDCPACRDERVIEQEAERKKTEWNQKIGGYMSASNIPKRYRGLNFSDLDFKYQKKDENNQYFIKAVNSIKGYLKTFPERLRQGSSGFFCGECGTGKTMLACMIIEKVINQGYPAHYTTTWQMIQNIRLGYKKGEASTQSHIKKYINKALLVIDEIGVQNGTNDERVLLYQVIDGRYNEIKPTILISNSKNPVEDGYLDIRTIDRLKEGNGFSYTFNGESYRK